METRRQIDAKVDLLQEDPERYGTYDPVKAEWITDFGEGAGLILYAVESDLVTVIVLRLQAY